MNGGDICTCGHLDDAHEGNELLGLLEDCKYCKCKAFEWGGIAEIQRLDMDEPRFDGIGYNVAETDEVGFNTSDDDDDEELAH